MPAINRLARCIARGWQIAPRHYISGGGSGIDNWLQPILVAEAVG